MNDSNHVPISRKYQNLDELYYSIKHGFKIVFSLFIHIKYLTRKSFHSTEDYKDLASDTKDIIMFISEIINDVFDVVQNSFPDKLPIISEILGFTSEDKYIFEKFHKVKWTHKLEDNISEVMTILRNSPRQNHIIEKSSDGILHT